MQLSAETLKILKNFNEINGSIFVPAGSMLSTLAPSKSILARAKVQEDFPQDFAIYEISKFLTTLSMLEEPNIDFDEKWMIISSKNTRIKYVYCNPRNIVYPAKDKKIELPKVQVQFSIDAQDYTNCIKALNVLSLSHLMVKGNDGTLSLQCLNLEDPTSDVFSVDIGKTDKEFEIIFAKENLKVIPDNYEVGVVGDNIGMSKFKSDNIEYFIALDVKSWIK